MPGGSGAAALYAYETCRRLEEPAPTYILAVDTFRKLFRTLDHLTSLKEKMDCCVGLARKMVSSSETNHNLEMDTLEMLHFHINSFTVCDTVDHVSEGLDECEKYSNTCESIIDLIYISSEEFDLRLGMIFGDDFPDRRYLEKCVASAVAYSARTLLSGFNSRNTLQLLCNNARVKDTDVSRVTDQILKMVFE